MIETRKIADMLVARVLRRRLDAEVAPDLKTTLIGLADGAPGRLVVDLGAVEFIDSSGLGALVGVLKHCGAAERLELAGLSRPVRRVFDLTRMTGVFRIREFAPAR